MWLVLEINDRCTVYNRNEHCELLLFNNVEALYVFIRSILFSEKYIVTIFKQIQSFDVHKTTA